MERKAEFRRVKPWSDILVDRKVGFGSGLPTRIIIERVTGDPDKVIENTEVGTNYPITTDAQLLSTIKALHAVFSEVNLHGTGRGQDFIRFLEDLVDRKPVAEISAPENKVI